MSKITVYAVEILESGMEVHRIISVPSTLEAMQKLVGGHIEYIVPVGVPPGIDMWINEEGRDVLPESLTPFYHESIFGNYFLARHNNKGDTTSLTDEDLQAIVERVKVVKGI